MNLEEKVLKLAKSNRTKIGIGLIKTNKEILKSLVEAKKYVDITVVGVPVKGFKNIVEEKLPGEKLAKILISDEVHGIVRGNLVAGEVMNVFAKKLNYKQIFRAAVVKDIYSREFFLAPGGVAEGNTKEIRLFMASKTTSLIKEFGIEPKVGVLSIDETRGRTKEIDQSIEEALWLVKKLRQKGINAEWKGYAVEEAVKSCNFIVPPNGVIGNFIWRSIIGFGGGSDLGDPGLIKEVFVDDSKYWNNFYQPIIFAAALVNLRKKNKHG